MKNTLVNNLRTDDQLIIPNTAHFVHQGNGAPVVLIHGIAASHHDWDDLIPQLTKNGYASYALDLLGHGDSPKPNSPAYHMDWLIEHFIEWMRSLHLTEPAIVIGHSLGGYVALEYARRASSRTRGLILVNPFYSRLQLSPLFRRSHTRRNLRGMIAAGVPKWILRAFVDLASITQSNGNGLHSLPEHIREQTALDYARTAPGVYNVTHALADQTEFLSQIHIPTLVVWGDRDQTLAPVSFPAMIEAMPRASGESIRAGHVPHQSNVEEFNQRVLKFIKGLPTN